MQYKNTFIKKNTFINIVKTILRLKFLHILVNMFDTFAASQHYIL
jgi:hypothetical protein